MREALTGRLAGLGGCADKQQHLLITAHNSWRERTDNYLHCSVAARKPSYLLVVAPSPMLAAVPGILKSVSPIFPLIRPAALDLLLLPPVIFCVPFIYLLSLWSPSPVAKHTIFQDVPAN